MLRVSQNENEIIIREIPVVHWTASITILIVLAFIGYISFLYQKDFLKLLWIIVLFFSAGGFLFYIFASPGTTTKINKTGKTISVRKESLIKYTFDVYSFNEIADLIFVDTKTTDQGTKVYQLIMPLKSGEEIELSASDGSRNSQYFDAAYLMNPYIFDTPDQIPFKLTVFNDD